MSSSSSENENETCRNIQVSVLVHSPPIKHMRKRTAGGNKSNNTNRNRHQCSNQDEWNKIIVVNDDNTKKHDVASVQKKLSLLDDINNYDLTNDHPWQFNENTYCTRNLMVFSIDKGRETLESIPNPFPLRERTNLVVTNLTEVTENVTEPPIQILQRNIFNVENVSDISDANVEGIENITPAKKSRKKQLERKIKHGKKKNVKETVDVRQGVQVSDIDDMSTENIENVNLLKKSRKKQHTKKTKRAKKTGVKSAEINYPISAPDVPTRISTPLFNAEAYLSKIINDTQSNIDVLQNEIKILKEKLRLQQNCLEDNNNVAKKNERILKNRINSLETTIAFIQTQRIT